jgi:PAS domain S-box-containing protein
MENNESFLSINIETLFDAIPVPVGFVDANENIIKNNKEFTRMFGYTDDDYTNITEWALRAYPDPEYRLYVRELWDKDIQDAISSGSDRVKPNEYSVTCADGTVKQLLIEGLFHNDGMIVVFNDVTELKKKDKIIKKQSKLVALGKMMDAIAHQWKQPISVISMVISNLKLKTDMSYEVSSANINEAYVDIQKQIEHLDETINAFRQFFRPNVPKTFVNLKLEIDNTLALCKNILVENYIKTEFSHVGDVEYELIPTEFKHVLINLIDNAKDAFHENNIIDRKILFKIIENDKSVCIYVQDNAGGIPDNIINTIFEPNVTSKKEGKGTGIGLYMTKQIIDKLNGTISVENKDAGARFSIELPLK